MTRREASGGSPPPDLRLLLPALLAWGIVALLLGRGPWPAAAAAVVAALVAVTCLVLGRRRRVAGPLEGRAPVVALGALLVTALATVVAGAEARADLGPVAELAQERATVTVTGRLLADPRPIRRTEAGPARVAVPVLIRQVTARGDTTTVRTPVLVVADDRWSDLGWRDTVTVRGRLTPADPGRATQAVFVPQSPPGVQTAGPVVEVADTARAALRRAVGPLPEDARGLLPAMVVGDRSGVPDDLTAAMTATGMSHLTAVSGTNCSLVLLAVMWLCGWARVPRRARPWVGAGVLAVFVVLARPDPSVLRAAVMGAIGLLGVVRSRRGAALPALGGAIVVLLLVDPWLARSPGFALSVLATLGLVLLAGPWGRTLRRWAPWAGPVAEAFAVPLAAQVLCLPVLVVLQGEVSLIGVLTNVLAAPLVAPVTILGALALLLAPVWSGGATGLAWVAAVPAWGIATVARLGAASPVRALPWPDGVTGAVTATLAVVVVVGSGRALVRGVVRRWFLVPVLVALLLVVVAPVWWIRSRTGFPGPAPAVAMCDVGQGDALVLLSGPGHAVVVDAGPDAALVDRCLDRLRIDVVDAVVLTHFDTDHVGGVDGVGRGRAVGDVVVSAASMPHVTPQVRRWWESAGSTVHRAVQGDRFRWGRVEVLVRGPRATLPADASPNRGSLILDATVLGPAAEDDVRALLLADADAEAGAVVRADLVRDGGARVAGAEPTSGFDIVKVAHHGSADRDAALLRGIGAPAALISVGADNRYGHPAPGVLVDLAEAGSTVYRSDRDGSVAIRKEAGALLVTQDHAPGDDPGGEGG